MSHASEISQGQPNLASVLSASYHFMMGRILDDLAGAGYKDLSKMQLHLLSRMDSEATTLGELATRVGIARQILDNLVHMLDENRYVHVQEERISLAERGRDAMSVVVGAQQRLETEWATLLGSAAYDELRTQLNNLFRITTSSEQPRRH